MLERALREKFPKGGWHRYDAMEQFTWDDTAYLPRHLKAELTRLRGTKALHVILDGPQGGFKPDTLVAFD